MLAFSKPQPAKRRAKVLLIGDPGSGKTHAALTFPKPAVIDVEGSSGWFADRFAFESVATTDLQAVKALVRQIRTNPGAYETVVVDSISKLYETLVLAATAVRADLRPLEHKRIKSDFAAFLDELYHEIPMHVVCTGWIKSEYARRGDVVNGKKIEDTRDLVRLGDAFDGDKKALHAFDFVFRLYAENDKRWAIVVKSRSGKLRQGERIDGFSWSTIAGLLDAVETVKRGDEPPPANTPATELQIQRLKTLAAARGIAPPNLTTLTFQGASAAIAEIERIPLPGADVQNGATAAAGGGSAAAGGSDAPPAAAAPATDLETARTKLREQLATIGASEDLLQEIAGDVSLDDRYSGPTTYAWQELNSVPALREFYKRLTARMTELNRAQTA